VKVLVSTSSFGAVDRAPIERLERHGFVVRLNPFGRPLKEPEIAVLLDDVEVLVAGNEPLTDRVLDGASQLRVISRVGVGLDNVDQTSAHRRGVAVFNTPDAPTDAVAELTIGGMLALLRQVPRRDRELRDGIWNKSMGGLLRGRTIGILGFGRIGRRVAELLGPFGVTTLATDPLPDTTWAAAHDVPVVPISELLSRSDLVTIHASRQSDDYLVGAPELARMKPGAYLLNTGRGSLVDEEALFAALAAERLGGAFVDVFEEEPYTGPLRSLPTVILTPHIGSYAAETRIRMELEAVDNVLGWLRQDGTTRGQ